MLWQYYSDKRLENILRNEKMFNINQTKISPKNSNQFDHRDAK